LANASFSRVSVFPVLQDALDFELDATFLVLDLLPDLLELFHGAFVFAFKLLFLAIMLVKLLLDVQLVVLVTGHQIELNSVERLLVLKSQLIQLHLSIDLILS